MIILWIVTFLFCIILIDAKLLTKRVRFGIYALNIVSAGILLGGIPNAVVPIQEVIITIGLRGDFGYLLPAIIVLSVLLISSVFVGRIFCGFACPLGALQEIISGINFKSNLKSHKQVKYRIDVFSPLPSIIRWIFLGVIILLAFLGVILLPLFNPLSGFAVIKRQFELAVIIPFISLIFVSFASIFLYRPWCRFICPFGAGSSLCGRYTRKKYRRTENCTNCGACEEICPTQEAGTDSKKGECYYCNRCIEICPHDAITLNLG